MKTWLNEDLNVKRNKVMGRRVVELLRSGSGKSQLFALGLGHYLGNQTIIEELRQAGFLVQRVTVEDDLTRWHGAAGHSGGESRRTTALDVFILCFLVLILTSQSSLQHSH